MTYCGGQIAETLLSEAARMAQFCRLNKGSKTISDGAHQRIFWVIFSIEKLSASCQGRSSVSGLSYRFPVDHLSNQEQGDHGRRHWLPYPLCPRSYI